MVFKFLFLTVKEIQFIFLYWKYSGLAIYNQKLHLKAIILITTIKQLLFIISWNFIFTKYQIIGGWRMEDMLIMSGIVSFGVGMVEIFFYGLRDLPDLIDSKQVENFFIQPRSTIFLIAASKSNILALGDLISSIIVIIYSGHCTKENFMWIIFFALLSCIFIFALYLILGSIAFFIQNSDILIKELYRTSLYLATQPNSIYRGFLKMITLTIIPIAYLSFYPIEYILRGDILCLIISSVWIICIFCISILSFKLGVIRYLTN